jgi:hypothetical protein
MISHEPQKVKNFFRKIGARAKTWVDSTQAMIYSNHPPPILRSMVPPTAR